MIEYLPVLRSAFLQGVLGAAGTFSPGGRVPPLEYGGVRFGPLICFESIFPYLARRQAAAGADILLVTTNDAWFGMSWAASQHFAQAAMRAAETRLPLARAANDGYSGLFLPSGRPSFRSTRREVGFYALDVPLYPLHSDTLYVSGGWLLAPMCAAFTGAAFLLLLVLGFRGRRPARGRASARGGGGGGSGGPVIRAPFSGEGSGGAAPGGSPGGSPGGGGPGKGAKQGKRGGKGRKGKR
jgi:apolipoprotein N-acyltransferase